MSPDLGDSGLGLEPVESPCDIKCIKYIATFKILYFYLISMQLCQK